MSRVSDVAPLPAAPHIARHDPVGEPAQQERARMNRMVLLVVGVVLMIAAPLTFWVPGPWSILIFAAGAGMVLRSSRWAKRLFVRFKRRWPKSGEWIDYGLRRESYKRRVARREEQAKAVTADAFR